ncbi:MAG: hypothetical protein R6X19_03620 [Kiritimatiellia bacterium]
MSSWSRASMGVILGACFWMTPPLPSSAQVERYPAAYLQRFNLLTNTYVKGIAGLQEQYRESRVRQLQILPPDPELQVLIPGGLTVFKRKEIPTSFLKSLVPKYHNGLPVYPVVVEESRATRETYFYNANGVRILTLSPERGYDPYAYIKAVVPSAFDEKNSAEELAWQLALKDPARVVIRFDLLEMADAKAMAEALTVDSEARAVSLDGELMATMSLLDNTSVTGLVIQSVSASSNGPVLNIAWGSEFTNRIEVMVRDSIAPLGWTPIPPALETAGSNSLTWTDTGAASFIGSRFYRLGDADADSDSDGLTDARELMVYGTRLDSGDTDEDALLDGKELLDTGTDPLNPDTDADALLDGEEVFGTAAWDVRQTAGCNWVNPGAQAQWVTNWAAGQVVDGYVDSALSAELPFSFVLGRYTSSVIRVSTDGYILLDPSLPAESPSLGDNLALPCAALGQAIAVFWDDMSISATQGLWVESTGSGTNNRVVITWQGAKIDPEVWNGQGLDIQCEYAAADQSYTFRYRSSTNLFFPVSAMCTVGLQGGTPGSLGRIVFNRPAAIEPNITIGAVPALSEPLVQDTDADSWSDGLEALLGMNPILFNSPAEDEDSDGLGLEQERLLGTDPSKYDTDEDGFSDGEEAGFGMDPLNACDWEGDDDSDGLTNAEEWQYGTNPRLADTDGDYLDDYWEVTQGSDPNDMSDWGIAPAETMEVTAILQAGEAPMAPMAQGLPEDTNSSPNESEYQPRGTIFQIGNYKLRVRSVNETAAYGRFRLSKDRVYELLVYTEEGNVEQHPVFTMISVDGFMPVPVADGWFIGSALVRNPTAALDWRKTAPAKAFANRAHLNGFIFTINGPGGPMPDTSSYTLDETVQLSASIEPLIAGTHGWATDVSVPLTANGSNASLTVSASVRVTATFTPNGLSEPRFAKTIRLYPFDHLCHWGTLSMALPREMPLNVNDSDSNDVPDREQTPPPLNDPDLRSASLSYDEGGMLACCRQVYSGARLTLTRSTGENKIRLWNEGQSGVFMLPFEAPIGLAPWEFLIEGVDYSQAIGDVRFRAEVTFDTADPFLQFWGTTVLFNHILLPAGSADGNPDRSTVFVDTETTYRYDWQAACDNTYGNGALYQIEGLQYLTPPYGYQWTLPSECGQLAGAQDALPVHSPPVSINGTYQDGVLRLNATHNQTNVDVADSRVIRVYDDHLRRDMANFTPANLVPFSAIKGKMIGGSKTLGFTCHSSVAHAATGSIADPYVWEGWMVSTSVTVDARGYEIPNLGTVNRGDVVAYYSQATNRVHSQICTGNGTETWSANNTPIVYDGTNYVNEWPAFATSIAGSNFQNGNPDSFPVTITVYKKPN